jgi:hypothetical protein
MKPSELPRRTPGDSGRRRTPPVRRGEVRCQLLACVPDKSGPAARPAGPAVAGTGEPGPDRPPVWIRPFRTSKKGDVVRVACVTTRPCGDLLASGRTSPGRSEPARSPPASSTRRPALRGPARPRRSRRSPGRRPAGRGRRAAGRPVARVRSVAQLQAGGSRASCVREWCEGRTWRASSLRSVIVPQQLWPRVKRRWGTSGEKARNTSRSGGQRGRWADADDSGGASAQPPAAVTSQPSAPSRRPRAGGRREELPGRACCWARVVPARRVVAEHIAWIVQEWRARTLSRRLGRGR